MPELKAVAAPSREDEVRWTLRRIKMLQLQGIPADEMAVLTPKPEVYRPLIQVIGWEFGITMDLKSPLAETPAANALISLLDLSPEFPWRETLNALRSPYFSQPWLTPEQVNQLEQLVRRINATNNVAQLADGTRVSDAIVHRDMLRLRRETLQQVAESASIRNNRYMRTEVRFVPTFSGADLRKQVDALAKDWRELDAQIQAVNWMTELAS